MIKIVMLAILAAGIILLIFGINAAQSAGGELSRFFSGSPTNKSVWMIVLGSIAIIVGLGGFIRGMVVRH